MEADGPAKKTVQVENTAQAYLELLRERGVDYFFGNSGTDFASLIDGFAKLAAEGKATPRPLAIPHEFPAVSMADGYYRVTGRPQVVMTHVIVGAANALGAIINAARSRVPILFSAGRTPLTEHELRGARDVQIHWAQESFDQGGMLREFVKWDYELRNPQQLETVVDRALAVAMTEPRGPIYLILPREVLAMPLGEFTFSSPSRQRPASALHPDPGAIEEAAAILAGARFPLIIAQQLGRDVRAVPALADLAERLAIPVVEMHPMYLNLPADHPMHLGYTSAPYVGRADAILVIESDAPWFPAMFRPPDEARIVQLGTDPLFARYPIRSFPAEVAVAGDPVAALPLLAAAIERRGPAGTGERRAWARGEHERLRAEWREAAARGRGRQPMDFEWVSRCIGEVADDETMVVNEYDLRVHQAGLRRPGSYQCHSMAGGLGWGVGAALGVKLAAPEKTVIATVGDGSYLFAVPTACHFVSQAYDVPILVVVFNNGRWGSTRKAAEGLHPDGWAARTNNFPLTGLEPSPRFELLVQAHDGYGERVERPDDLVPALRRALKAVREERRPAVLNVIAQW
jgi:acetolactate synthase-1/2/3 large subunit